MDAAAGAVRDGGEADLPAVASLRARSWADTYGPLLGSALTAAQLDVEEHRRSIANTLDERKALLLVAESSDGGLIGFSLSYLDSGEPYVESLHVDRKRRGGGVGAALLRATAARWAAAGFGTISLRVIASNGGARRFYKRLGGEVTRTELEPWGSTPIERVVYRWSDLRILQAP
jgi:2-amino-4-hydroxy-6-hydroxymethyldihydropteridine diphosphokinase